MKTRWKPVDLVCRNGDEEITVRTKLARDAESTGVCIAEAVSHALLLASGLADVILGNPDRRTHGNVLLARSATRASSFDLIPIDQSDAFFHPSAMIDPQSLRSRFDDLGAEMLDGTERVLMEGGTSLVETCFRMLPIWRPT